LEFPFFLLLNFVLFVRPIDYFEGYEELPIYNIVLLATLLVSAPKIANYCLTDRLFRDPITACVLGLIPAIALSHMSHFDLWSARMRSWDFIKVAIYYLTLVSVVNSTLRLRFFLYSVAVFATITAGIASLDFLDFVEIPCLRAAQEALTDPMTGERSLIPRLVATGLFNDPNDLAMISVFSIMMCVMGLCDNRLGLARVAFLAPLAVMFLALILTKSRGGMLAFVAACGVLSYCRFGLWKTGVVALMFVPALALVVSQRATDIGNDGASANTAHSRIELWACGLVAMKKSPVFGIGAGFFPDECELVAHNSYVHCFVELGLFGGALFLGAYWFSALGLWKLGRVAGSPLVGMTSSYFRKMQPFILAGLVGFAVSQLSLSRPYSIPTYIVFGAAQAFSLESQRQGLPPVIELNSRRVGELLLLSVTFLLGVYLLIRLGFR
jgi:O-antigen ligase